MGTDRVICRNCGNTDSDKMDFTSDRRYVYCHICNSTTPLYNDYKIVEIEGVQGLQNRLENGEKLIALGKYREAEEKFKALTEDYAGDYRTWLGLAHARSDDFSSGNIDWDSLRNARAVAEGNPEACRTLDQLVEHCRSIEALQNEILAEERKVSAQTQGIQDQKRYLSEACAPVLNQQTPFDSEVENKKNEIEEKNRQLLQADTAVERKLVLLTAAWAAGGIFLYKFNYVLNYMDAPGIGHSSFMMLIYFLIMVGGIGAFIIKGTGYLKLLPRKRKLRGEISTAEAEMRELQQQVQASQQKKRSEHQQRMASFREMQSRKKKEVAELQAKVNEISENIGNLRKTMEQHRLEIRRIEHMGSTGI